MSHKPLLLIPAKNEAAHLPHLLDDWSRHAALHTDLCLVLDNCTDESASILSDRQADPLFPPFRFLTTQGNANGKAGAVMYALDFLPEECHEGRTVVLWDADREYDLAALPPLLEGVPEHPEARAWTMISGVRTGTLFWSSSAANRCIRTLLAFTTGRYPPRDVLTGVRVLPSGQLAQALCNSRGFDMETRIVRHFLESDGTILEWPISYQPRRQGKKIKPWHLFGLIRAAVF